LELQQIETHQTLIITLGNDEYRQLALTFEGVAGLQFLPGNFQPVPVYLKIVSIADRQ